jgi:hypothetical protein
MMSSVSFNRDNTAGAEDTACKPRPRTTSTVSLNWDVNLDSQDTGP